ncbi:MAG: YlbF family regulator [Clostridia bacterium]|nr:YlbF family regulator [Clostridia bacterium]
MGIFELAAELGRTLKEDKRLVALEEARVAYENDERVGRLMTEYEVQQKAIQNEAMKAERNDELIRMIQDRIDALYTEITETETYRALEKAQNEVNELMEMVNTTITFQITGKTSAGCTHDCSTCGGCH